MSLTVEKTNPEGFNITDNKVKRNKLAKPNNINPEKKDAKTNKGKALHKPLQRQGTFITSRYRYRKSISQIDMKLAHKNGLLQLSPIRKKNININGENLTSDTGNNGSYFSFEPNEDLRIAAMRVYQTLMLNAWRKRCEEVNNLRNTINELKTSNVKAKNQLHVYKALFNVEKKSNEELSLQIKSANEQICNLQESESFLKNALSQNEAKLSNTEMQLMMKTQDHHAVNIFFKQTKTELFEAMSELHELRIKLDAEQQKISELEEEKQKIFKNVELVCERSNAEEQNLKRSLEEKKTELLEIQTKATNLKNELINTKNRLSDQVCILSNNEVQLKTELEALQSEVKILRRCLAATVGQRFQNCLKNTCLVQRATFHMMHCFAASLLPAVPAPKIMSPIPINFTLEKAMNIMKRS